MPDYLLDAVHGAGVLALRVLQPRPPHLVGVSYQYSTVQYTTVQPSTVQYWQTDKREYCKLFDHMALIVDLGGQNYLVDVGFGNISQPSEPIRCNINFFLTPVTCALVDKVQKLQIILYIRSDNEPLQSFTAPIRAFSLLKGFHN